MHKSAHTRILAHVHAHRLIFLSILAICLLFSNLVGHPNCNVRAAVFKDVQKKVDERSVNHQRAELPAVKLRHLANVLTFFFFCCCSFFLCFCCAQRGKFIVGILHLVAEKSIYDIDIKLFTQELCFANNILVIFPLRTGGDERLEGR